MARVMAFTIHLPQQSPYDWHKGKGIRKSGVDLPPQRSRSPSPVESISVPSGVDLRPQWSRSPSPVESISLPSGVDLPPQWSRSPSPVESSFMTRQFFPLQATCGDDCCSNPRPQA
ncbi:hypothetical protein H6P81_010732 [Aristolochia fimbriata]|uniref:Uncharacterized protein n=1 Tax=Aristolochia fimbriata TaxID=158543 RepID=A0AAV7ESY1_ARIFI|nr:hypothetical protein H6P81_010732 [Aristolochia fimbriata]